MPRRTRSYTLETRTSRLKLPIAGKPHLWTPIAPGGVSLGYRRNGKVGSWVIRLSNGRSGYRTSRVGYADDHQDADGDQILTWFQAVEAARKLAKGGAAPGPLTVAEAVDQYQRDLVSRGDDPGNAQRIRKHLGASLAARPVNLLTTRELSAWRDELLAAGMKPATLARLIHVTRAAFNLASKRDPGIANQRAWLDGLAGVREDYVSRNAQRLTDDETRSVIAASYAIDAHFGRYAETGAETGARPGQLSRLLVTDLQGGPAPRLMMPASKKGRGNRRRPHYPVPISLQLAAKLAAVVAGREPQAPLLTRRDGRPWQDTNANDYALLFGRVTKRLGLNVTFYALRHSMIIRGLLANVPIRVIAATTDTSVSMIERTYSSFITSFSDEIARRALIAPAPASADVIQLRRG
jgi:hypothetical protein